MCTRCPPAVRSIYGNKGESCCTKEAQAAGTGGGLILNHCKCRYATIRGGNNKIIIRMTGYIMYISCNV